MNNKKTVFFLLILLISLLSYLTVYANIGNISDIVDTQANFTKTLKDIIDTIKLPIQILTVAVAIILVLIRGLFLSIIQDEKKRAEVVKGFLWTFIGLGIVFFGITIFSAIINIIAKPAGMS